MKKFVLILSGIAGLLLTGFQPENIEMADGLRSEGLIYIVVLVVVILVGGLLFYLFTVDRKVTRLENEISSHEKE